jgi:transposase
MKALSLNLHQRIVTALESGQNRAHIAARFEVSESSVYRLQRQWKSKGDLAPKKRTGRGRAFKDEDLALLETLVAEQTDPTGARLVSTWHQNTGKRVGLSTVHRALHQLKMSFKKRAVSPAKETKPSTTLLSARK